MSADILHSNNEKNIKVGPYILLKSAMLNNKKIIISCNNNHKYIGFLKTFDRHCNLLLTNVTEYWKENKFYENKMQRKVVETKKKILPKIFFRGDSIILISKYD